MPDSVLGAMVDSRAGVRMHDAGPPSIVYVAPRVSAPPTNCRILMLPSDSTPKPPANSRSGLTRSRWKKLECHYLASNGKRTRRSSRPRPDGRPLSAGFLEARGGIEPPIEVLQTSALPLGYRALFWRAIPKTLARGEGENFWSGRRGSNPRLRPWQGRTLPLSYSRSSSHSTAVAHLLTIYCTRTRSSALRSYPLHSVLPFGRNAR